MRNTAIRRVAIGVVVVIFLLPVAFMFSGALRPAGGAPPEGFDLVPDVMTFENFRVVTSIIDLWRQMTNSAIVVALAVPTTVLIASWAGFAIVTGARKTRRLLLIASVVALMVPATALWVPRFVMFRWAGLLDSFWPLVAPSLMATSPFYVLLFALAYSRIPRHLFDAARLEGLSSLSTWWGIAWPLGRPTAFAVAMLAFVFHWSNFIDALLYLSTQDNYTLPLGLRTLQTLEPTLHPLMLAGAAIATVPALVAFLLGQRALFARTLEV